MKALPARQGQAAGEGLADQLALVDHGGDAARFGPFGRCPCPVGADRAVLGQEHQRGFGETRDDNAAIGAAFAQGFVVAHDRLPQMDLLRRFGSGTISELFGAMSHTAVGTVAAVGRLVYPALRNGGYSDRFDAAPAAAPVAVADGVDAGTRGA